MTKEFCPYCETIRDIKLVSKNETLSVLGEPVEYKAYVTRCDICSNDFATSIQEKDNFRTAYAIFRERHNLLSPEKISEIRKMYGLSQRSFSSFLGWGEITIHRYESGAIQDKVHNETLALLEDPRNALKILELNRNDLDADFYTELEHRIKELIKQNPFDVCFQNLNIVLGREQLSEAEDRELSGKRLFDQAKFENLILYFLEKCTSIGKTKLNKLLWYADFMNYKNYEVSITGAKYVHLQYGPVPNNYDYFLLLLSMQNKITSKEVYYNHYAGEEYYANVPADVSVFLKEEIAIVDHVSETLGNLTATQLKEKSHEEEGYKATKHLEFIPYTFAEKLSI